jgi:HK97 gp10 family phage protein
MIAAELIGAERVVAFLELLPQKAMAAIKADVSRLAITLLRKVKKEKLSGQVLKNQTGTLRRSINQRVEVFGQQAVVGSVGTNLRYAKAHEFGTDKTVTVPAHLRMMKVAWGKAVKNPRKIEIGAHAMKMHLPERSFLRSAMAEMAPEIREGLEAAMSKAVKP